MSCHWIESAKHLSLETTHIAHLHPILRLTFPSTLPWQAHRQMDGQTNLPTYLHILTHIHTCMQADRQTDGWTDRDTHIQTSCTHRSLMQFSRWSANWLKTIICRVMPWCTGTHPKRPMDGYDMAVDWGRKVGTGLGVDLWRGWVVRLIWHKIDSLKYDRTLWSTYGHMWIYLPRYWKTVAGWPKGMPGNNEAKISSLPPYLFPFATSVFPFSLVRYIPFPLWDI